MLRLAMLGLAGALLASPVACPAGISLSSDSPNIFETVRVLVPAGATGSMYDDSATRISMAGNKITVTVRDTGFDWGPNPPSPAMDIAIGQFPKGTYAVELRADYADGSFEGTLGSASFTVSGNAVPAPRLNYSDLWWKAGESGWGLNVIQHGGGKVFATWFVYGADGKPVWYVVPDGQWTRNSDYWDYDNEYAGPVYRTTGPALPGAFDPSRVSVTPVGTAVLRFDFIDDATIAITTDRGTTYKQQLTPQSF